MTKTTYNDALKIAMDQPAIPNCTMSRGEIEEAIKQIGEKLKWPLSNIERLLLVADRAELRSTLKSLAAGEARDAE